MCRIWFGIYIAKYKIHGGSTWPLAFNATIWNPVSYDPKFSSCKSTEIRSLFIYYPVVYFICKYAKLFYINHENMIISLSKRAIGSWIPEQKLRQEVLTKIKFRKHFAQICSYFINLQFDIVEWKKTPTKFGNIHPIL